MQTWVTDSPVRRRPAARQQYGSALTVHGQSQVASENRMRNVGARAEGLGWFSIGLGLTQLLAPEALSRFIGVRPDDRTRPTMLAIGLREITAGVGILTQDRPKGWLWARVAGDVMDLAMLGKAFARPRNERDNLSMATAAVLSVLALDYLTARDMDQDNPRQQQVAAEKKRVKMTESVTLNRSLEEVSRKWREYEDQQQTGLDVKFAAAPGGHGTELRAQHDRLKGPVVMQELRHFKQVVETGEVVHSDASIHRGPHPAQPSAHSGKKAQR